MPELPEVETIRMGLEKYLVGHKILQVEVKLPKIVAGDTKNLIDAKFTTIERFGKGLVLNLSNNYSIAIHIKLTGQLIYIDKSKQPPAKVKVIKGTYGSLPNKWTHVIFHLDRGATLFYNDFRQFGWIKIIKTNEVEELPFFRELGPELPVLPTGALTFEKFKEIVNRSKTAIKPLLMDQKKIGGIGNIYANDGLFLAGIDPQRRANTLSDKEAKTLYDSLLTVLKKGLKYGGASELSFVNALGGEGKYQDHFLVYGQEGEPCPNKNGIIRKFMLGGRGTYVCEKCQH